MHAIRLHCHRINFHSNVVRLLKNHVEPSIKNVYLNYSTTPPPPSPNINDADQFKAAVLHPKKQNLTVETLVLPDTAADGMVKIIFEYLKLCFQLF